MILQVLLFPLGFYLKVCETCEQCGILIDLCIIVNAYFEVNYSLKCSSSWDVALNFNAMHFL